MIRTAGTGALSEASREFIGAAGVKRISALACGRREGSMSIAIRTEGEGWKASSRRSEGIDRRPESVR